MPGAEHFFVDTNVLLYSLDPADSRKQKAAQMWMTVLWEQAVGRLSWQVLHEFYVNAIRKLRTPPKKARATVEALALWEPVDTSAVLIRRAWFWMDEARLSYWDSLIVAAAERSGCIALLSEDFQEGQMLGSLKVINPFRTNPKQCGLDSKPDLD
jgi:predicted nucleic acid-binding protein